MENWLVTGGCGFIGSQLVRRLLKQGYEVRVVDNCSSGAESLIPAYHPNLEFVNGDIEDAYIASDACKGMDVVVHLAANTGVPVSVEQPRQDCMKNVVGTLNYLLASRDNEVQKFIFASSGSVLGDQNPPFHEEMVPTPVAPYGASKMAGEAYCNVFHSTYGLDTVALRFSNVYGPGSSLKFNQLIPKTIYHIFAKQSAVVFGDGGQTRDFTYIDDLLDVISACATRDVGGEKFQVATNRETSVDYIINSLNKLSEEHLGYSVNVENQGERKGDVMLSFADISKAKQMLSYAPKVDIDEGLRRTFEWFLQLRGI